MKLSRDFFIPKGSEHIKYEDLRADLYIYQGGIDDKSPCARAFINKQQKPLWGYRFRDAEHRQQYINDWLEKRRAELKASAKRKAERKQANKERKAKAKAVYDVGTILYTMWGYDQTNVDYYVITKIQGADYTLQQVSTWSESTSCDAQIKVSPNECNLIGEPIVRRLNNYGDFNIYSFASTSIWDGNAKYATNIAGGYGH